MRPCIFNIIVGVIFFSSAHVANAQQSGLDDITSKLAAKINRWKPRRNTDKAIFAVPFEKPGILESELGMNIASDVVTDLVSKSDHLRLIDKNQIESLARKEGLTRGEARQRGVAFWFARSIGATLFLSGEISPSGKILNVRITVHDILNEEVIGEAKTKITMTPEMEALLSKPFPSENRPPIDKVFSIDETQLPAGIYQAGKNGVSDPTCIRCPSPGFPQAAIQAKYQGSIAMRVVINAEGRAEQVQPLNGGPVFGLAEEARKAVLAWSFKPAMKDGKPVPVRVIIEVTFKLM